MIHKIRTKGPTLFPFFFFPHTTLGTEELKEDATVRKIKGLILIYEAEELDYKMLLNI